MKGMSNEEEYRKAKMLWQKRERNEDLTYAEQTFMAYSIYGDTRPCGSMVNHRHPIKESQN